MIGTEILERIKRQPRVETGIDDDHAGRGGQQRVAVGRRFCDPVGRDGATSPGQDLDHDRLAQSLGELVADQASDDVRWATGRKPGEHADRLVRIVRLCSRAAGDQRSGQCNHHTARQFHRRSSLARSCAPFGGLENSLKSRSGVGVSRFSYRPARRAGRAGTAHLPEAVRLAAGIAHQISSGATRSIVSSEQKLAEQKERVAW